MDTPVGGTRAATTRSPDLTDEITAELTVLTGFDQDLAAEGTRTSNRIRGLLTQFHYGLTVGLLRTHSV